MKWIKVPHLEGYARLEQEAVSKNAQLKHAIHNMQLAIKNSNAVAGFYDIFIHNAFLLSLLYRTSISVEY
jgi:hypothetical protein